jgi:hypothetical protein
MVRVKTSKDRGKWYVMCAGGPGVLCRRDARFYDDDYATDCCGFSSRRAAREAIIHWNEAGNEPCLVGGLH